MNIPTRIRLHLLGAALAAMGLTATNIAQAQVEIKLGHVGEPGLAVPEER